MRKTLTMLLCGMVAATISAQSPNTPVSQMEKLDRGLIVVKAPNASGGTYYASWRLLGTDDSNTYFEILRDGASLRKNIYKSTFVNLGSKSGAFQLVTYQNGVAVETSEPVTPWEQGYLPLTLDRPADGTNSGGSYSYSPNDCSVGDVDGDGQYEIFVKWDPSNSKDNSQGGVTGNVYIDCYKLDGTKLWRIDLGPNIRAGAHYTQFMVFDFDGDGQAELMCKTAPGSMDGAGNYVNQVATQDAIKNASNTKDWRTTDGRVNGGQEYLTVFNGQTGAAIHTIPYWPNRNAKPELSEASGTFNWGSVDGKNDSGSYGNRGERYLAAVAYLSGPDANPSGIFSRGYYGFAYIWAVDFDGSQLKTRWLHSSESKTKYSVMDGDGNSTSYTPGACTSGRGRNTMFGNGNHNLSIGDVDGDGKDEIIWGQAALDDDGTLLYSVGYGHGDAMHLGDLNPDHPGLELFSVHEDGEPEAWDIHDAATGEILLKGGQSGIDNGRGLAADILADSRGYEFWSSYGGFNANSRNQNAFNVVTGNEVSTVSPSMNFRIYWDGDPQDELLDGTSISKFTSAGITDAGKIGLSNVSSLNSPSSCNSTKATPCLMADLFGDWREEVIFWSTTDNATLNIYSTVTTTNYRVPTLMHDHTYRMGVAWQNVGYNQPPHLGYYLPDFIESFQGVEPTGIVEVSAGKAEKGDSQLYNLNGQRVKTASHGIFVRDGKKYIVK